jgi:hypothetical protein
MNQIFTLSPEAVAAEMADRRYRFAVSVRRRRTRRAAH